MKPILLAILPVLGALIAVPAAAQQRPPVPDPRLKVALSTTVIKETQRSVEFHKTMPQPEVRPRPAVNESDMAKVTEGVYVERRLLPPSAGGDDPEVVRIRRTDR